MADAVYSSTLGLAMLAAAAAWLLLLAAAVERRRDGGRSAVRLRAARLAARWVVALVAFSCLVHLAFGHRPGSLRAMPALEYLAEHPAFPALAVSGGLAWAVANLSGARQAATGGKPML